MATPVPNAVFEVPNINRLEAAQASGHSSILRLCTHDGVDDAEVSIDVPASLAKQVLQLLQLAAAGHDVAVVAKDVELTTQRAADLLGVSRPHLVALLERGAMPFRKVGSHRRVLAADLVAYKALDDAPRHRAAAELTADSQALGLGY